MQLIEQLRKFGSEIIDPFIVYPDIVKIAVTTTSCFIIIIIIIACHSH